MYTLREYSDADRWNILKMFVFIGVIGLLIIKFVFFSPLHGAHHGHLQRQTQCQNQLKQIGLALQNYHDKFGSFPPAYIPDETGRPMHTWRVLLLPFLGEQELYDSYNFNEPWNSTHNISLQDRIPDVFRCPEYQRDLSHRKISSEYSNRLTNYVAIDDPTAVFNADRTNAIKDITDGASNTILVVEVHSHAVHWMQPEDVSPEEFLQEFIASRDVAESNHEQGFHVLFGDGAVRTLKPDVPIKRVKKLLTKASDPADGDPS